MNESATLRIVVFKEEDMFVAQCLEHDVAVQAPDMSTLQRRFEATLVHEGAGLEQLPPAPDRFHKMWDEGLDLESKVGNAEMRLAA